MGFTPYTPTPGTAQAKPSFTAYDPSAAPPASPAPVTPPLKTGSAGQTIDPSANALSDIGAAAKAGADKAKQGLTDAYNGKNPVESALKMGSGIVDAASAPLAPLFSPLGKLIGYISDKLSNHPAVQDFALSKAGEATSRAAEDISNASDIAGAVAGVSKASPIQDAIQTGIEKTAASTGKVASQALGATTGAGAESVKQAFNGGQAFTDALRGKINPDQIVSTAQDAVQNIAESRRSAYLADLSKLSENKASLDISPINTVLQDKLSAFGIKVDNAGNLDFSRSSIANNGSARADVQGVYDTLKTWGTQTGDRTPVGLDTLKKQLSDFYSPSGSARALVQAVKSKVSDVLKEQVPGYTDMTAKYGATSQLLDDIKSATGVGGKAKADTIFTKLTTALKGDKEFRLEMLGQMQAKGAQPDLMEQIAGINMSSAIPKGLVGKSADVGAAFAILGHYFSPQMIPALLATSPRVVGEFVHALGMTKGAASAITGAIAKASGAAITGGAAAAPQATQAPGRQQTK